jgi:hypothetical protein
MILRCNKLNFFYPSYSLHFVFLTTDNRQQTTNYSATTSKVTITLWFAPKPTSAV